MALATNTVQKEEFSFYVNAFVADTYYLSDDELEEDDDVQPYNVYYTVTVELHTNLVLNAKNGYKVGTYDPDTFTITFTQELIDAYEHAPHTLTLDPHTPYSIDTRHDCFLSYKIYYITLATLKITTDHVDGVIGRIHPDTCNIIIHNDYANLR